MTMMPLPFIVEITASATSLQADNQQLVTFFDQGWADIFEVYVDRYGEESHPERQIGITIFVKEKG